MKPRLTKAELKTHALEFIRQHPAAVLATATASGRPEAATMYFHVDNDFTFYFMAAKESQKIKNITQNPHVAFVVGVGIAPITIQGFGVATLSTDVEYPFFAHVVKKIKLHHIDQMPLMRINKDSYVTITVKPDSLMWLNLDKAGHPETYYDDFNHLIGNPPKG